MTVKQANRLFTKHRINIELFGVYISVFFDKEDYAAALAWRGEKPINPSFRGEFCVSELEHAETGEVNTVLMMAIFDDNVGLWAHEATHAAMWICDRIGHTLTPKDELIAYLVQHIVEEIEGMKR